MAYLGLLLVVLIDNAFLLLAPDRFGLRTAPPDLPLVTALYLGFRARNASELGLAIVLGALVDCFSARPLGHFAFLYGSAAYFALHLRRYVPSDAFVSHIVACLFCGLLTALLGLLLAVATGVESVGPGFSRSLLEVTTSALVAPFVFSLWDRSRLFQRALGGRGYEFGR
ncbi:MAG: rod shape-determining protein MreD [Planctomycetota bacterium]|jgi:rod shape-determining protein MreD